MLNRRDFFKIGAGAAAGLGTTLAMNAGAFVRQPPAQSRRQVVVGGKRVRVVDVHGHCTVGEVAAIVNASALAGRVTERDLLSRPLGPERLPILDARGIDVQALSINGFWWYAADRDTAREIVRVHDERLADWCSKHPGRFVAFTSVALQFPDLAAEQLEHAVKRLGARGASIGGHVNGQDLSDPRYDPFWAKAQELEALVFMHPTNAEHLFKAGSLDGRGDLSNIIGNPLETSVFLSRLIFDGTFDRFPGLKICAAHAGGYLPSYLGRTDVACDVRDGAKCANKRRPRAYFTDQIFVDSMIFSPEGLRHLVAEVGARQIVFGTDIPFNWPAEIDLVVDAPFLSDPEKEAILGGTLVRLLRLDG